MTPLPILRALAPAAALVLAASGCSFRVIAKQGLGSALRGTAAVYASESDPELVRDAFPFLLKTTEALIQESPRDPDLLLSACQGFTQYAYAFVELDALEVEPRDYARALELRDRAFALYGRARDYGLRALEVRHPGIREALRTRPWEAVEPLERADVPSAYWIAAAWGSAIGVGLDRPEAAADVDAVRALLSRSLALDESWNHGTLHEAAISIEALPEAMGGSPERAREHFRRAVELGDDSPSPYVALAVGVALPAQDVHEFRALLGKALAIDPDADPSNRLRTLIGQKRARLLLARVDDLFIEVPSPDEPEDAPSSADAP